MAAPSLRTQPIDRRRLKAEDRSSYNPSNRLSAISRVKSYKAFNAFNSNVDRFRTERTPGTGGFTSNLQAERMFQKGQENRRAEQFRQENLLPFS